MTTSIKETVERLILRSEFYAQRPSVSDRTPMMAEISKRECADVSAALGEAAALIERLAGALDDLVMAVELPGDHCELQPALERARRALSGEPTS